jgi:AcrR family transcriptional regulator
MPAMATRRYEQRLRAESAEETRQRILDGVRERVRAAPTEPVSLDAVARTAKVARSTIYLVFGSRAGLFEAVVADLVERGGFDRLVAAVEDPDARVHLRGGITAGVRLFETDRDVCRVLFAMDALDPDSVGGAVRRWEDGRAGGMAHLARRLAEQGLLRPDVTVDEAAHALWVLTSFASYDLLRTGRGLDVDAVAEVLAATAERSLLVPPRRARRTT